MSYKGVSKTPTFISHKCNEFLAIGCQNSTREKYIVCGV